MTVYRLIFLVLIFGQTVSTVLSKAGCDPDFMAVRGKYLQLCKRFIWRNLTASVERRVLTLPREVKDNWQMCMEARLDTQSEHKFQIRFMDNGIVSASIEVDLANKTVEMEDRGHGVRPSSLVCAPSPFPVEAGRGFYLSAHLSNHLLQYSLCGERGHCKTVHHSVRDMGITKVQVIGKLDISMVNTWCMPDKDTGSP